MHASKRRTIVLMGLSLMLAQGCAGKDAERSCLEPAAQAQALDYVRDDLIKFFGTQGAEGMEPSLVALEAPSLQSRDEASRSTTCSATLAYRAGDRNQSAAVVYAWAPGGREGDEYSARIWPATP